MACLLPPALACACEREASGRRSQLQLHSWGPQHLLDGFHKCWFEDVLAGDFHAHVLYVPAVTVKESAEVFTLQLVLFSPQVSYTMRDPPHIEECEILQCLKI